MSKNRNNLLTYSFIQSAKLHRNSLRSMLRGKGVYRGQPPLLFALEERNGQRQKELAEYMDIKPATLTIMLQRTEKNGLIKRENDPTDQRIIRVYLTPKGRQVLEQVKIVENKMEQISFGNFTDEEKELFLKLLEKMYQNLELSRNVSGLQNETDDFTK